MAHYARVENGIVKEVIVAEQDFIDNLLTDKAGKWIQTSYNTAAGVHTKDGTPLRKNFAGIDYHYDGIGFYPPKPFNSWTFNNTTYLWEAPVTYPTDGDVYRWNETDQSWDAVE
tara:strand:- start:177 stop:518 length:342 start_codon:yes stop_codon:yes gene_type:complete